MVKCPRCQQVVDETVYTTCPACSTALTASVPPSVPPVLPSGPTISPPGRGVPPVSAPPPNSGIPGLPMAGGVSPSTLPPPGANVRVSLTGEVIEDRPSGPAPNYVGSAPIAQMQQAGAKLADRKIAEAKQASNNGVIFAVLAVVAVLVLGIGGYWAVMHRTNPKEQAQKFASALKNTDWEEMYSYVELTADEKTKYPDAKTFATKVQEDLNRRQPGLSEVLKPILKKATITVGTPTVTGMEASVPMEMKLSFMGQSQKQKQTLKLRNHWGIWKIVSDGNGIGGMGGQGGMGSF